MTNSLFISHASEDKDEIARPIAKLLKSDGFEVWFDEFSLNHGDSLMHSIDRGLATCDYAIVILSHNFFKKKWTQRELIGLATRELHSDKKIILPIWHKISLNEVINYSPPLADKYALDSSLGLVELIKSIKQAIHPKDINISPRGENKSIVYLNGHNRYTIKDSKGHIATAKKTNWLYSIDNTVNELRDGGIQGTGKIQNVTSNLGDVDYRTEGGTKVAYTRLKELLEPYKIYEHTIEFETIDCYTETRESVGTNLLSKFEIVGQHVFFPEDRRPSSTFGALIFNGKETKLQPSLSKDNLYLNLIVNDPPAGSRIILEWEW